MKSASFCVPLSSQGGIEGPLAKNSYIKLPNGLIIQYGVEEQMDIIDDVTRNVEFPIPFPSVCVNVNVTARASHSLSGAIASIYAGKPTQTGFTIIGDGYNARISNGDVFWIAIGY